MSTTSSQSLFVYGTLRHPAVRRAVLGDDVPASHCRPASLSGHQVLAVAGTHYPLIQPVCDAPDTHPPVEGLILSSLSDSQIAALDRFEGVDYQRVTTEVTLPDGSTEQVDIYRTINPLATDGPWVYDIWLASGGLEAFISDELDPDGVKRPTQTTS